MTKLADVVYLTIFDQEELESERCSSLNPYCCCGVVTTLVPPDYSIEDIGPASLRIHLCSSCDNERMLWNNLFDAVELCVFVGSIIVMLVFSHYVRCLGTYAELRSLFVTHFIKLETVRFE